MVEAWRMGQCCPERPLEEPRRAVAGHCAACGEEILVGEAVYRCDEGLLHPDADCIFSYLSENCGAREVAEAVGLRWGAA